MTVVVQSPQLAILALEFIQDDVRTRGITVALRVDGHNQPVGRLDGEPRHNLPLSMGGDNNQELQHLQQKFIASGFECPTLLDRKSL